MAGDEANVISVFRAIFFLHRNLLLSYFFFSVETDKWIKKEILRQEKMRKKRKNAANLIQFIVGIHKNNFQQLLDETFYETDLLKVIEKDSDRANERVIERTAQKKKLLMKKLKTLTQWAHKVFCNNNDGANKRWAEIVWVFSKAAKLYLNVFEKLSSYLIWLG